MKAIQIHIYSDGGYFEKQNIGGWGAVIFKNNQEHMRLSGWQKITSSLEMELTAACNALHQLKKFSPPLSTESHFPFHITLFTDSQVLIEGLQRKIPLWRQHHWVHKSGNLVKYQALWETLEQLTQEYNVRWQWVKGHNGDLGNELADQLAREAITERNS